MSAPLSSTPPSRHADPYHAQPCPHRVVHAVPGVSTRSGGECVQTMIRRASLWRASTSCYEPYRFAGSSNYAAAHKDIWLCIYLVVAQHHHLLRNGQRKHRHETRSRQHHQERRPATKCTETGSGGGRGTRGAGAQGRGKNRIALWHKTSDALG